MLQPYHLPRVSKLLTPRVAFAPELVNVCEKMSLKEIRWHFSRIAIIDSQSSAGLLAQQNMALAWLATPVHRSMSTRSAAQNGRWLAWRKTAIGLEWPMRLECSIEAVYGSCGLSQVATSFGEGKMYLKVMTEGRVKSGLARLHLMYQAWIWLFGLVACVVAEEEEEVRAKTSWADREIFLSDSIPAMLDMDFAVVDLVVRRTLAAVGKDALIELYNVCCYGYVCPPGRSSFRIHSQEWLIDVSQARGASTPMSETFADLRVIAFQGYCKPPGWGCCGSQGQIYPLDGSQCCSDGNHCPPGSRCVRCSDDVSEICCRGSSGLFTATYATDVATLTYSSADEATTSYSTYTMERESRDRRSFVLTLREFWQVHLVLSFIYADRVDYSYVTNSADAESSFAEITSSIASDASWTASFNSDLATILATVPSVSLAGVEAVPAAEEELRQQVLGTPMSWAYSSAFLRSWLECSQSRCNWTVKSGRAFRFCYVLTAIEYTITAEDVSLIALRVIPVESKFDYRKEQWGFTIGQGHHDLIITAVLLLKCRRRNEEDLDEPKADHTCTPPALPSLSPRVFAETSHPSMLPDKTISIDVTDGGQQRIEEREEMALLWYRRRHRIAANRVGALKTCVGWPWGACHMPWRMLCADLGTVSIVVDNGDVHFRPLSVSARNASRVITGSVGASIPDEKMSWDVSTVSVELPGKTIASLTSPSFNRDSHLSCFPEADTRQKHSVSAATAGTASVLPAVSGTGRLTSCPHYGLICHMDDDIFSRLRQALHLSCNIALSAFASRLLRGRLQTRARGQKLGNMQHLALMNLRRKSAQLPHHPNLLLSAYICALLTPTAPTHTQAFAALISLTFPPSHQAW
ncbi:uncharacterized protein MYCFIDRAFT_174826 [Pseudocercospora fijiensis CIRAD86]|uniref:Uncharacterized protein n=1 Tax=Pseudocercospora fijiensis (strain CIRAD86) TaxID=383855 RepID=M3B1T8_PSEFD|nr:uncharacterized protein MYCFIDRAFT_174826 [Pseudocercospora fijiensis CIRAD86]EME83377.1 hypothetical protein MYCFIDRAFT_174826 [Pseudocercospora fijiensis CIRAD86]